MSGNTNKIIDEFDNKLLEKIDQQLMHIEAIKNYDPVKAERDELKKERDDFKGKLAEAHNTISRYEESTGRLDWQLREEKEKVDNLARHNKVLTARVEKLQGVEMAFFEEDKEGPASGMGGDAARSVTGRHGEDIAGRSDEGSGTERQPSSSSSPPQPRVINLAQAERRFLKAKEEDIKRRAEEQLNSIKQEWERIEKPKLVTDAAVRSLKDVVEHIIDSARGVKAAGGNPSLPSPSISSSEQRPPPPSSRAMQDQELYAKVRSILDDRIRQGLDYEFERRVEAESQNRAEEKFEQIANTEWPNYYNQTILPLANELKQMIAGNVFNFLAGPWTITCKICGAAHRSRALSPEEVETLISTKSLEFQCYGAYFRSQINLLDNLSGIAHTFRIGLLELIQDRLVPEQEDGEEEEEEEAG
jgi:hypothetical protein